METKKWYRSKTMIWAAAILVAAATAFFGKDAEFVQAAEQATPAVLAVIAVVTAILRGMTSSGVTK